MSYRGVAPTMIEQNSPKTVLPLRASPLRGSSSISVRLIELGTFRFGLGTPFMPVASILFSIEIAIAITAIVHRANSKFKVAVLGKNAIL